MSDKNKKQYLLDPTESWLNRALFLYLFKLNSLGAIKELSDKDYFKLHPRMQHDEIKQEFNDYCNSQSVERTFSQNLLRYLIKTQWRGALFLGITASIEIINPYLIRSLIRWIKDDDINVWTGPILGASIVIVTFIKIYGFRYAMISCTWSEGRIASICPSSIFTRILQLKSATLGQIGKGFVNNILVGDMQLLYTSLFYSNALLSIPFIMVPLTAVLIYEFGYAGVLAPLIFLVVSVVQYWISMIIKNEVTIRKEIEDVLGKKISEIARGAKEIKQNAWEGVYIEEIKKLRISHSNQYFSYNLKSIITTIFSTNTSLLLSYCIMFVLKLSEKKVTLEDSYFLISICFIMYYPIRLIATAFYVLQVSSVVFQRMDKLMIAEPGDPLKVEEEIPLERIIPGTLIFNKVSAGWVDTKIAQSFPGNQNAEVLALNNITFTFLPGKFYAVIGEIGAGKSTLLQSGLQEIYNTGRIEKNGDIAFVPQEAFLINNSLRNNITFFKEFDEERYIDTLARCCLLDDLLTFNTMDLIEIGERGINLSGGQKQRISLARALYSNRDIYLIDDALSALDAEVGKTILNEVFIEALSTKTRIIVTHATYLLDKVDEVVLMKSGKIIAHGPFSQIKETPEYKDYDEQQHHKIEEIDGEEEPDQIGDSLGGARNNSKHQDIKLSIEERKIRLRKALKDNEQNKSLKEQEGRITTDEKLQKSVSQGAHYFEMIKNGGIHFFIPYILTLFIHHASNSTTQLLIARWATEEDNATRFAIYSGVSLFVLYSSAVVTCYFAGLVFRRLTTLTLVKLIHKILRRPMSFFDMTPVGQIIERTIGDRESMDYELTTFSQFVLYGVMQMIILLSVICFNNPVLILVFLFLLFIFLYSFSGYVGLITNLRKLTHIQRAPVYSKVSEAFDGITLFRSFGVESGVTESFNQKMRSMITAEYHERFTEKSMFVRSEILSMVIISLSVFSFIGIRLLNISWMINVDSVSLALSGMMIISGWFGYNLYALTQASKGAASVERILEWCHPKEEDLWEKKDDPNESFVIEGKIAIKNLTVRYRSNLEPVLKNISLLINPKEKVGIVGRTGSGKSTLILALKRLLEIEREENEADVKHILIDDVDITKIGLWAARRSCMLIPQDPFLMKGTLRSNVDPFNRYSDEDVIEVLKSTQIYSSIFTSLVLEKESRNKPIRKEDNYIQRVESLPMLETVQIPPSSILNYLIEDSGSNLSQGQRQLICIARALISHPKILLMDEATANIDTKTDKLIQDLIATKFSSSTVITIAHRIKTIVSYDRIVVLGSGRILEMGNPRDMLLSKQGSFYELVKEGGDEFYEKMLQLAK